MVNQSHPKPSDQSQKFEKLARQLECDEDEEVFKAKLVKVAKGAKPKIPQKR